MIPSLQERELMTSSVTGRNGKVRHNSLNQSDCPPPLRPTRTNNNAFVWGCTPLVRSYTHTQTHTDQSTAFYDFLDSHREGWEKQCFTSRTASTRKKHNATVWKCAFLQATWLWVYVFTSRPGHMTAAAPFAPLSKPEPLLIVGERSHGLAFLSG